MAFTCSIIAVMSDFAAARLNMVNGQIKTAGVINPAILAAFGAIPREKFVRREVQGMAYADEDVQAAQGRFLLEPITHARMIEAATPEPGDIVLDIGGGSGYSAAVLSQMVTTVIALEEDQKLLERATQLWTELDICNVVGVPGQLAAGNPANAPFTLIMINGAVCEIPENIVAQLAPQGRLVTVVRKPGATMGRATLVRSLGNGAFSTYDLFDAGTPYLPGFEPLPAFTF